MITPKEYIKNLKKGIITDKMLEDALVSVNKRAKNYRDKKREYKEWCRSTGMYDKYGNIERCEKMQTDMYQKKDALLSLLKPIAIHKEGAGFETVRHYDYESDYEEKLIRAAFAGTLQWDNSFYDYENDFEVNFFDEQLRNQPKYRYYLYYALGDHTYHTPINEEKAEEVSMTYDIPIVPIAPLDTIGQEITDLLSIQFVDKMLDRIVHEPETIQYVVTEPREYPVTKEPDKIYIASNRRKMDPNGLGTYVKGIYCSNVRDAVLFQLSNFNDVNILQYANLDGVRDKAAALVKAYTDSSTAKNATKLRNKVKDHFRISRILSGPVSDFVDIRYIKEHLDAFLEDMQAAAGATSREFAEYISPEIAGWNEKTVVKLYAALHLDELLPEKIRDIPEKKPVLRHRKKR